MPQTNTRVPQGYTARPVVIDDIPAVAGLMDAESRWLNGAGMDSAAELQNQWTWDFFNLATDTQAVFTRAGQAAGYIEMWDVRAPHVNLIGFAVVHPDHLGCGIGTFLAGWVEERARRNIPQAPADARVTLNQSAQSNHQPAIDLLTRRGYHHHRSSYRMRIDFNGPPPAPALPGGIEIRPIQGKEEERLALFTRYESFLDHYGTVEEPFEAFYQRWQNLLANDSDHDPTLWFLAMDGGEPAGVVTGYERTEDDPDLGWVQWLGVRKPWRRRGLGQALLLHAFNQLYARGKPRAGLSVDASSLTGADRLYERVGMHVERVLYDFELELRPGKVLTRQNLD